jgi:hypothetical protein
MPPQFIGIWNGQRPLLDSFFYGNHETYGWNNRTLLDKEFTRSRPYKKNDNAHVEQKNWTHVRENFGYERYDLLEQAEIMNVIYKLYLNNLYNFFVPQLKLIEKVRVGSKIVKKYDKPKTPYQRLLDSEFLTIGQKEELRRRYELLNPIELREIIKRQTLKLCRFKQDTEPLELVA